MRELERELFPTPTDLAPIVVIGRGRVGGSIASAAEAAGVPLRLAAGGDAREASSSATAALLCVPDGAIEATCAAVCEADVPPALVGHVSGASTLDALASARSARIARFSLHPLQTFPHGATDISDVPAAVAGEDAEAQRFAAGLADALGMRPFAVPEERRAAYHAAASIASNFLVALEESAAELLDAAGVDDARDLLAPLVIRSALNWAEKGGDALTGPIARGDAATVERHRAALAEIAPELLPLYEALAERTHALAAQEVPA
jgi:predicted short-subunit dehydrogenase-like oxidoreductase (DUF2520 family)